MSETNTGNTSETTSANDVFTKPASAARTYIKVRDLEKGSVFEGTFKKSYSNTSTFKGKEIKSNTHIFETSNGKEVYIDGVSNLDRRMEKVAPESVCRITYRGKDPTYGNYQVMVDVKDAEGKFNSVLFEKKTDGADEGASSSSIRKKA